MRATSTTSQSFCAGLFERRRIRPSRCSSTKSIVLSPFKSAAAMGRNCTRDLRNRTLPILTQSFVCQNR